VINDRLASDAGCVGYFRSPGDQEQVRHLLLTHSHIDHLASLPIFIENIYTTSPECPTVYGSSTTLDSVRRDLFNNRIWPDFVTMSEGASKFLRLQAFEAGQTLVIEGLHVTAVALSHVVPTLGFIVADEKSTVAFVSDTGPTEEIWHQLNQLPRLDALFVECCFPNALEWLALVSLHLTPRMLVKELTKLRHAPRIFLVHLKPRYRDELIQEVAALHWPRLEIGSFGVPYEI
jgi:cAMP phosphodiesterase